MVEFLQGPGRNIKFCSITTGIDIDPNHGGIAQLYFEWFKSIIIQKTETHYENDIIREIEMDASPILPAYTPTLRHVYQFLYGTVEHTDPWTPETLTEAVDAAVLPKSLRPNHGEYSIDFYDSKENGMKLFENQFIAATDVWVEKMEFYFSNIKPWVNDGDSGDTWFVSDGKNVEIWYKSAFKWTTLEEYVTSLTPAGNVTYSAADPGNSTNDWWFDLTGIVFRKYTDQLNIWEPAPPLVISDTAPTGLSDGDLWLRITEGKFIQSRWSQSKRTIINKR